MGEFCIGVLGGMGTYATIHMFERYAALFPAEKEWDRPRIIIDNYCTLPSRVRAWLYNENVEPMTRQMTDAVRHLLEAGCTRFFFACNTSHLFLPAVLERLPEAREKAVNIIDTCADALAEKGVQEAWAIGSEGTMDSGIYQKALEKRGIRCLTPEPEDYPLLRTCIEAVKQNVFSDELRDIFVPLVRRHGVCILGCTEFPVLYDRFRADLEGIEIFDPLELTLEKLHAEYSDWKEKEHHG